MLSHMFYHLREYAHRFVYFRAQWSGEFLLLWILLCAQSSRPGSHGLIEEFCRQRISSLLNIFGGIFQILVIAMSRQEKPSCFFITRTGFFRFGFKVERGFIRVPRGLVLAGNQCIVSIIRRTFRRFALIRSFRLFRRSLILWSDWIFRADSSATTASVKLPDASN